MIVIGSRNDALLQQRGKAMAIEMAADQVVAASMNLAFRMPSRVPQNRLLRQRYYVNKLDPFVPPQFAPHGLRHPRGQTITPSGRA